MNIMVVDDERVMTDTLGDFLSIDHNVIVFNSSADALKHYKSNLDFDVIFTDFQMPQMSGDEFIKEILVKNSTQRIIIMSGFTNDKNLDRFEKLFANIQTIQKPFDLFKISDVLNLINA
ncbi:MAG: hypothetical protein COA79_20835 [Planctomycetota bacterium]|nr:MAG: hypothetical protein COA79_20835 [Planctomycetota bacterium]